MDEGQQEAVQTSVGVQAGNTAVGNSLADSLYHLKDIAQTALAHAAMTAKTDIGTLETDVVKHAEAYLAFLKKATGL